VTPRTAVVIGAGPAGLTAAYEFLDHGAARPTVLEATGDIGGLSKTVVHAGNRIDLGGHRFFSRSAQVMEWWQNILPVQGAPARDQRREGGAELACRERWVRLLGAEAPAAVPAPDPERTDAVMLVRDRVSRILFAGRFFDYPIRLNRDTLAKLGARRAAGILLSYLRARAAPVRPERSLEDFFVNRFGRELYRTFFKDYTEKVWGVSCRDLGREWGAQRVKGLSVGKALGHALRSGVPGLRRAGAPKAGETSLIERFLYPKLGPGQLWEEVSGRVERHGGQVIRHARVVAVETMGNRVAAVRAVDERTGRTRRYTGEYFVSSMPVPELLRAMGGAVPAHVREVGEGLQYRDFMIVGVLLKGLRIKDDTHGPTRNDPVPDQWIYIQERTVRLGRVQIFNNWSPYLVADPATVWIGLEYFCAEGDDLWAMSDPDLSAFAVREAAETGILAPSDVLDTTVLRVRKAYPSYSGSYSDFEVVRKYCDGFANLFLVGRNGMHRYNNMDHSMLTAMSAVDCIERGRSDHAAIWEINAEEEYHERA
jgi:protoporphyrinogen oxidase